jgi:hypothetical protein
MAGSLTTTTFTGVQIGSDQDYDTRNILDLSAQSATLLVQPADTAAPSTSNVLANELSLLSHSVNSVVLAYRSGATVYVFTNDGVES